MVLAARTLKSILKDSVSHGAQEFSLHPYLFSFHLAEPAEDFCNQPSATMSFLERIRMWLRLLWGDKQAVFEVASVRYDVPLNRYFMRRRSAKIPAARQGDALGYHILCRYGLKRLQEWLYNRTLTGRVRWCFRPRKWRWLALLNCAVLRCIISAAAYCGAPLRPD